MGEGDGKVVLEDAGYFPEAIALKNSSRRVVDSVNAPAVSTVVVAGSCFSTPRIFMQRWSAVHATMTPLAPSFFITMSHICAVRRSCTCRRRA